MDSILNWIAAKLKWLLVLAAIGGPVLAFLGWQDLDRVHDIAANGIEAEATIVSAVRKRGRRSGRNYYLDLAWKDDKGDRTAEEVLVTSAVARRHFLGDRIVIDKVRIKYLPDRPGRDGVVLVDDIANEVELDRILMFGGAGLGLAGFLGCAWMLGFVGRLRSKPGRSLAAAARRPMGPPAA